MNKAIVPPNPEDFAKESTPTRGVWKYVDGEPDEYTYSSNSILSLGQNFDPSNITKSKLPAISFQPYYRENTSTSAQLDAYFVRNRRELEITVGVSGHAEARALGGTGRTEYSFDNTTKFTRDSVTVMVHASAIYGRRTFDPNKPTALNEVAADLLQENQQAFAKRYGTRYIGQELYGAMLAVAITVDGLDFSTKTDFMSQSFGKGSWGSLGGEAKAKFTAMLRIASKQARVSITARSVGGTGIAGLGQVLSGEIASSENPLDAVLNRCRETLQTFTKENAAPIRYKAASMRDFGWNPGAFPGWPDTKEEAIQKLADDFHSCEKDLDIVRQYESGVGIYPRLMPNQMEWAIPGADTAAETRAIIERYRTALVKRHAECLSGEEDSNCTLPEGRYADWNDRQQFLHEEFAYRARPPVVQLKVLAWKDNEILTALDGVQSSAVLKSVPSARLSAVQAFAPEAADYSINFSYGGAHLVSHTWVTRWSDGNVKEQPGRGTLGWFSLQFDSSDARPSEFERSTLAWLGRHRGNWTIRQSLKFIDRASRTFEVQFLEAAFTANGSGITGGTVEFLASNAQVSWRF